MVQHSAWERSAGRAPWLIIPSITGEELPSAASRGRADGRGVCSALLCQVNPAASSLLSDTVYLAITLAWFSKGSICPRKGFTLPCAATIFPPTEEHFYFSRLPAVGIVPLCETHGDSFLCCCHRWFSVLHRWVCVRVGAGFPVPGPSLLKFATACLGSLQSPSSLRCSLQLRSHREGTGLFWAEMSVSGKKSELAESARVSRMLVKGFVPLLSAGFFTLLVKTHPRGFGKVCLRSFFCFASLFLWILTCFPIYHLAAAAGRIPGVGHSFMTSLCL